MNSKSYTSMARAMKEEEMMAKAISSSRPLPTRMSLPRASKRNKPNYKVDMEEDDAMEFKMVRPKSKVVIKKKDAPMVNETETRNPRNPMFHLSSYGFERLMNERSNEINESNATKYGPKLIKGTLTSWLIDMRVFKEFTKIQLRHRELKHYLRSGMVTRDGVICDCCNKTFSLTGFGVHGGETRFLEDNINITETSFSLYNLVAFMWSILRHIKTYDGDNKIENKDDPTDKNDDTCIICADGGNLICCSSCPSTYHQRCLNLQIVLDNWKCPYCCCKYCGDVYHKEKEYKTCQQCEKKYHYECYGDEDPRFNINSSHFCCIECNEIHDKLQKILAVKQHINEDLSCTLMKAKDKFCATFEEMYTTVTRNLRVAVATKLMEDSFEPIIDRFTKINVVRSVGLNCKSNFPRIDFSGFYTIMLESREKEEIISVASIRIHGSKIAEMPFIATSDNWRGKGMCKTFVGFIEKTLRDVGVEHLYIPSTSPMKEKWISNYGFKNVSEEVMKEITSTHCLMFLRAKRLQKDLQERKGFNFLPDLNFNPPEDYM